MYPDAVSVSVATTLVDVYLLALAVSHGAGIVTLDGRIPTSLAIDAKAENLLVV